MSGTEINKPVLMQCYVKYFKFGTETNLFGLNHFRDFWCGVTVIYKSWEGVCI